MFAKFTVNTLFCIAIITTIPATPKIQDRYYEVVVLSQADLRGVEGVCVDCFADGAYRGSAYTNRHGIAWLKMKPQTYWSAVYSSSSQHRMINLFEYTAFPEQTRIVCMMPVDDEEPIKIQPFLFDI